MSYASPAPQPLLQVVQQLSDEEVEAILQNDDLILAVANQAEMVQKAVESLTRLTEQNHGPVTKELNSCFIRAAKEAQGAAQLIKTVNESRKDAQAAVEAHARQLANGDVDSKISAQRDAAEQECKRSLNEVSNDRLVSFLSGDYLEQRARFRRMDMKLTLLQAMQETGQR